MAPPSSLPVAFRRVRLVTLLKLGHGRSVFDDMVSALAASFAELGAVVDHAVDTFLEGGGTNIVLQGHSVVSRFEARDIPQEAIVINTEPWSSRQVQDNPIYLELLRTHVVWDYSERNGAKLREALGNPAVHRLALGDSPVLHRVRPDARKDIDVLFYGELNPRRQKIIDQLLKAGLNVVYEGVGFGSRRDDRIQRAKVVLNIHFYEDRVHEIVRTSYLLANGKAVVSECEEDTEIDEEVRQSLVACPYSQLVPNVLRLVRNRATRRAVEARAREVFSKHDQTRLLRDVIERTVAGPAPASPAAPSREAAPTRPVPILLVSHSGAWNGAEKSFFRIVQHLDRRLFDPRVASPENRTHPRTEGLNARLAALGIPVARIDPIPWVSWGPVNPAATRSFLPQLGPRVRQIVSLIQRHGARLVYSNTCVPLEGALAARVSGVPHVWHIRERLATDPAIRMFVTSRTFVEVIETLSSLILVPSAAVKQDLESLHRPMSRIRVVHNGIEPGEAVTDPSSLAEVLGSDPGDPLLLYVGALIPSKGVPSLVETAVEVLKVHPRARFVLIGEGGEVESSMRAKLRNRGVEDSFHFLGFRADAATLMSGATALLLPSLSESFSNVVLEAMGAGIPVVATRCGGPEEMVIAGQTGHLVPPGDPREMARAVIDLLGDPTRARHMGLAGRDRVMEHFTMEKAIRGIEAVLHEALEDHVQPRAQVIAGFRDRAREKATESLQLGLMLERTEMLENRVAQLETLVKNLSQKSPT